MSHPTPPHGSARTPPDEALLQDLLDGRLDDAEVQRVRARIEREPRLQELWADLRRIQAWVRGQGPQGSELEPPADFLAGVRARLAASADPSATGPIPGGAAAGGGGGGGGAGPLPPAAPRGRLLRLVAVAYAAAALVVVGFTVKYVFDAPGDGDEGPATDVARHAAPRAGARPDEVVPQGRAPARAADDDDGAAEHDAEAGDVRLREKGASASATARDKLSGEQAEGEPLRAPSRKSGASLPPAPSRDPAPSPSAGGVLDASKKHGGHFGAPGGALPPRVRPRVADRRADEPADEPADDRGPPAAEAKAKDAVPSRLARLAAAVRAGEIIYVVETRDRVRAEAALLALFRTSEGIAEGLGKAAAGAGSGVGAAGPGSPKRAPKTADAPAGAAGSKERDDGGRWGAQAAFERVYRLDVEQALRLAEVLSAARAENGFAARKDPLPGTPGLVYAGELLRDLPSLAGLESLRRADGGDAPALADAKAEREVAGGALQRGRDPRRPAPVPAPAPAAPATPAPPKAAPRPASAPATKAKARGASRPVRVRILVLERR